MILRSLFVAMLSMLLIIFFNSDVAEKIIQPLFTENPTKPAKKADVISVSKLRGNKQNLGKEDNNFELYGLASAHPLASQAGMNILENGGNALDAAIAIMANLTLVEPQSSGFGGGAFMLYWDAKTKTLHSYDGREIAPSYVKKDHFFKDDGKKMGFYDAVVGGKSFGIPGIIAMLDMAKNEFGTMEYDELYKDAIILAKNGFPISERLHNHIKAKPILAQIKGVDNYFFDENGELLDSGTFIKNPAYAETLENIAEYGIKYFYNGPIKDEIIQLMKNARNPVSIKESDFENYKAIKRENLCIDYKEYKICSFPLPSSGGLTMFNILNILENFDLSKFSNWDDSEFLHLYIEASKLAYADRGRYMSDPDFLPQMGVDPNLVKDVLASKEYAKERSKLIDISKANNNVTAGDIVEYNKLAKQTNYEPPSTSHFSIKDKYGNIVSMTATIESHFGNHYMAGGMFLNNELTDFSFEYEKDGQIIANSPMALKRPRSSMTPTIIFKDNEPFIAIGSPGGSNIIGYVAKSVLGILEFDNKVQDAINLGNISTSRGYPILEDGSFSDEIINELKGKGHDLRFYDLKSGINGVKWDDNSIEGGSDKRGEGNFLSSDKKANF